MRKLLIEIAEYAPRSLENLLAVSGVCLPLFVTFSTSELLVLALTLSESLELSDDLVKIDTDTE